MRIVVDGLPEEVDSGLTLAGLIEQRQEDSPHMIAEVNRRYVRREDYQSVILTEGDVVELIHPDFGG